MAQLYADENFDLAVVERLRTLGHDTRAGSCTADDADALAVRIDQAIATKRQLASLLIRDDLPP